MTEKSPRRCVDRAGRTIRLNDEEESNDWTEFNRNRRAEPGSCYP